MRYIIYARKSSESEDRQVASIESQLDELKKLAKQESLNIVGILPESQSAKAPGRKIFNLLIKKIQDSEADGIICWKLDRLARNPVDGGQISWMLQQNIIKHIRTSDRNYYPTDNVLMMSVELGMANQFIRDLSDNTKRGLRKKASQGHYPTYATLGYMHDPLQPKGKKGIIPDPERFPLVRKLLDLILSGQYSPPKALDIVVNRLGLRSRFGKPIAQSTLYRILSDTFYYGDFEYPKGSGNWFKGCHPPMITKDEFDTIQKLLHKGGTTRSKTKQFAYTGLIRCGECGAMITAEDKVKHQKNGNTHEYTYYHCTKRKNTPCHQSCIRKEELEQQILEMLSRIEIPPDFANWTIEQLKEDLAKDRGSQDIILANLHKQYNACLQKIDNLIDMRASQLITDDEFQTKKQQLASEKERINELLGDTDNKVDNSITKFEGLLHLAESATYKFNSGTLEEKRELLACLGSNLYLIDKKLQVDIEKPLTLTEQLSSEIKNIEGWLEPTENSSRSELIGEKLTNSVFWLRGWDSNPRPTAYTNP
ncbi:MAG: recombinase family protein [Patescibacteria group bacterium]